MPRRCKPMTPDEAAALQRHLGWDDPEPPSDPLGVRCDDDEEEPSYDEQISELRRRLSEQGEILEKVIRERNQGNLERLELRKELNFLHSKTREGLFADFEALRRERGDLQHEVDEYRQGGAHPEDMRVLRDCLKRLGVLAEHEHPMIVALQILFGMKPDDAYRLRWALVARPPMPIRTYPWGTAPGAETPARCAKADHNRSAV